MGERLPARARLSEPAAFQRALRSRPQSKGVWCRLFVAPKDANAAAQLGMVVPKKLLRTSVRRNIAKRHVRESFRLHAQGLVGCDVVVQVIANDRAQSPTDWARLLRADIDAMWARVLPKPISPP